MSEVRGMVPPNSLEAERSVLGAMLQDPKAVMHAVEALKPEDFYQPQHREIFGAMLSLFRNQRPVDITTLDDELGRRGTLEGVGGTGYLMGLMDFVPTTANVQAYIDIVTGRSILRQLIDASQHILQESYSQQDPVQDIMNHAEKAIFDVAMRRSEGESLKPVREVLQDTVAVIE